MDAADNRDDGQLRGRASRGGLVRVEVASRGVSQGVEDGLPRRGGAASDAGESRATDGRPRVRRRAASSASGTRSSGAGATMYEGSERGRVEVPVAGAQQEKACEAARGATYVGVGLRTDREVR